MTVNMSLGTWETTCSWHTSRLGCASDHVVSEDGARTADDLRLGPGIRELVALAPTIKPGWHLTVGLARAEARQPRTASQIHVVGVIFPTSSPT